MTSSRPSAPRGCAVPRPYRDLPILSRDLDTETAIIGGGYAGLNAAIRLTEHGRDAVVLDAHEPGFGASGRNGGQVIPGLKYDPYQLIERFGEKRGRPLAAFAGSSAAQTFDLIERYELKCDARRCGWLQPSVDSRTTALVHRRAALWKEFAGVQTTVLDAAQTKAATGTSFYIGAWIDPRGGQLQPLAYARELARVAASRGVRIFRNSRRNPAAAPRRSVAYLGQWRDCTGSIDPCLHERLHQWTDPQPPPQLHCGIEHPLLHRAAPAADAQGDHACGHPDFGCSPIDQLYADRRRRPLHDWRARVIRTARAGILFRWTAHDRRTHLPGPQRCRVEGCLGRLFCLDHRSPSARPQP